MISQLKSPLQLELTQKYADEYKQYFDKLTFQDIAFRNDVIKTFNRILAAAINGNHSTLIYTAFSYSPANIKIAFPGMEYDEQADLYPFEKFNILSILFTWHGVKMIPAPAPIVIQPVTGSLIPQPTAATATAGAATVDGSADTTATTSVEPIPHQKASIEELDTGAGVGSA